MSQFFYIHPDNPQQRLINQAVEIVRKGGVIVYPTDSGYALGHARGSNWVVNSGCPQALKASGSYGNSRRTPQRGNYEPVFLYSS